MRRLLLLFLILGDRVDDLRDPDHATSVEEPIDRNNSFFRGALKLPTLDVQDFCSLFDAVKRLRIIRCDHCGSTLGRRPEAPRDGDWSL